MSRDNPGSAYSSPERRKKRQTPKSSRMDTDDRPSIQRDISISPIDGRSLLEACLVAPTRNKSAVASPKKKPGTDISTVDMPTAFSGRVENVVRDAYKDVKARRAANRKELIKSVIGESLNGAVNSYLAHLRQNSERTCDDGRENYKEFIGSHNGRHVKNNEKERRENIGEAGSPKKRNRKRNEDEVSTSGKRAKIKSLNGVQTVQTNGFTIGTLTNEHHPALKQASVESQLISNAPVQRMVFPRLPSNNCRRHSYFNSPFCTQIAINDQLAGPHNLASDEIHAISIKIHNSSTRTENNTRHQPLLLEGTHPPRPTQSSVIFLKSFFSVEDERNLAHVPYFGEETNEDFDWDLFDIEERMKLYEYGPPHCEKETIETIDEVLKLLAEKEPTWFRNNKVYDLTSEEGENDIKMSSNTHAIKQVHIILAQLSNVRVKRVKERHTVIFASTNENRDGKPKAEKKHNTKIDNPGSPSRTQKKNFKDDPTCYQEAIDTYRNLFCRICFTYDCQIHGNIPKADIQLLGELAIAKDHEGHWNELDKDIDADDLNSVNDSKNSSSRSQTLIKGMSAENKAMCERLFVMFGGDSKKIARVIDATTESVDAIISEKQLKIHPPKYVSLIDTGRKKKGKDYYQSMKNYNPKWLANIQCCEIHPSFMPCDHIEQCSEKTCSCVQNKFFCNKACVWGSKSKNFFRGCACKAGQCRSSSCPCWAANRECDPDLCQACGACTDPPQQLADKQRCRNDNISMRRHARLLLAESSINAAGWGLFTRSALKKGSFVHEYVGEVISQEEAERRGIIYDKLNMSYLFNLSSDYSVDATRKGNKLRYANHSSNAPNCEAKMVRVNGDMRIGLFAKVDIDAQTELFFDYRYDETIDNELIIKPAHKFHWMKNPARKNDKKSDAKNIPIKAAKKNAY